MEKATKIPKFSVASLESSLQRLEQRHRTLSAKLSDIGLVLRGSIALRHFRCGTPTCRCKADPPKLRGPYCMWTRKVAGKTVNVSLTPAQAARLEDWNRNMHKLDRIVRLLQAIGLRAATLLLRS